MSEARSFPRSDDQLKALFVDDPIYSAYKLEEGTVKDAVKILHRDRALDAYCTECNRESVFHVRSGYKEDEIIEQAVSRKVFNLTAECKRDHPTYGGSLSCPGRLYFTFILKDELLIKVGQYPSKADLDFGSLDPVFKELESSLRGELGRAVGLRAHGVGVGSFVYLRRIFEKLIEEAHGEAKKQSGWDEKAYRKVKYRMIERIKLLRDFLPNTLVETASLYGIVSKGVHELTDQECLDHFDLVKTGIETILRERHDKRTYKQIVKDIQKLSGDLGQR